ncbi:metal ABC transporter substrate-binding protein [Thermosulfuriphilus sp.]
MAWRRVRLFLLVFLIYLVLGASAGVASLKVVASIFPLYDFVREVGGERVKVHLLLPPGAEPHSWEPRPSDILAIYRADLLVVIGAGLEPWLDDLLAGLEGKRLRVLVASQGAELLGYQGPDHGDHRHHGLDPHIWLDLAWDQQIVFRLAEELSRLDPQGRDYYFQRARSYAKKLAALDRLYASSLSSCRERVILIAGHGAYAYLARRYSLRQVALFSLSPEAEPSPQRMIKIIKLARRLKARAIFFEAQANPRLARALASEAGLKVLVLNPGASLNQEEIRRGESFLEIMEANLEALRCGLSCLP